MFKKLMKKTNDRALPIDEAVCFTEYDRENQGNQFGKKGSDPDGVGSEKKRKKKDGGGFEKDSSAKGNRISSPGAFGGKQKSGVDEI